ncbi:hypothetical protein D9758_012922 [Tetrapyrgos nigripes]|uniref:Uncharacterized protein n=1 Tax=Tetrapyrgos nigripes TaxID=182062 RepID=A0A8H5CLH8_9AGAR|nr:hypothetical protein D9758_012922 [Tetrapyrgos nigripes]
MAWKQVRSDRRRKGDISYMALANPAGSQGNEEFYFPSVRMELHSTKAIELMHSTMDKGFVGDELAMEHASGVLL